jgi:hypothetical protein
MSDSFGREVEVEFRPKNGPAFFINDLRVSFDIDKATNVEPNKAFIKIWNMNADHRGKMAFRWNTINDKYGGEIRLRAGYDGELKQIFRGAITQAIPKKVGPDWITEIEGMTLLREILEAKVTRKTPYPAGTPKFQIFKDLLDDLGVATTARSLNRVRVIFGNATIKKSVTLYGSAAEVMNRLNKDLSDYINVRFTDDGVELLRIGEAINTVPIKLWPGLGLLGTPEITIAGCNFKSLLRHDIQIGTLCSVRSETVDALKSSGNYVVRRLQMKGDNREGEFTSNYQAVFPNSEARLMR